MLAVVGHGWGGKGLEPSISQKIHAFLRALHLLYTAILSLFARGVRASVHTAVALPVHGGFL